MTFQIRKKRRRTSLRYTISSYPSIKMNFQAYTLSAHPLWACIQVKTPDSETRTPVHLCCVIDTSASMSSDSKLENVKQSLQFLLDFLSPQDSISVITFSEVARTILTQTFVSPLEKDNIRARISIIRIESNTNLSASIIQARECLQVDTRDAKQGILLLTDGVANVGLTRPQDILDLVRDTVSKFTGTSISSVGYGTDHNVELLQNISIQGGGSYYVVNNLEDVATVFGDILGGLVSCAAQQVRIILPSDTEVKSRYAKNMLGSQMEIVIGDLSAGSEAAFLAKIPAGQTVLLKGYDLLAHNTFELNTVVNITDDSDLQINGEAHYLRFEVLALLEQSRGLMNCFTPEADVNQQITKIEACITTITEYRITHEHSLWDILLEELNNCKRAFQDRGQMNVDTPHIMTQHAGYLGRMRGLPAALSQVPSGDCCGDPDMIPPPPTVGRTFSNYVQRQISSQLCATVSGGGVASQGVRQTQDPTIPILHRSTGIYPANNILPNPEMTPLSVATLVPPSGPLLRQVACSGNTISRSSSDGYNN